MMLDTEVSTSTCTPHTNFSVMSRIRRDTSKLLRHTIGVAYRDFNATQISTPDDIDTWFRSWRDDEPNSEKEYELIPPTPDMIMECGKGGTIPVGQPRNHVSTSSCDQPRCFSCWTTNGSHIACSQTGGQTGALPASSGEDGIMYLHRCCWAQKYQQAHVPRIQTSVLRRESDEACRSECRNYYDMPLVWHTQILMQL